MFVEIRMYDSEDIVGQRVQWERGGECSIERSREFFQGSIKWSAFLSFREQVFVDIEESQKLGGVDNRRQFTRNLNSQFRERSTYPVDMISNSQSLLEFPTEIRNRKLTSRRKLRNWWQMGSSVVQLHQRSSVIGTRKNNSSSVGVGQLGCRQ